MEVINHLQEVVINRCRERIVEARRRKSEVATGDPNGESAKDKEEDMGHEGVERWSQKIYSRQVV